MLQRISVIALAIGLLVLGGCASKPKGSANLNGAGPATEEAQAAEPRWDENVEGAQISRLQDAFATQVGDRVYFALDSHVLTQEGRDTLTRQAAWLLQNPGVRALIAGNCDERGTREYNFALGGRRAAAARAHLLSQGVPASRLSTVSYGKERPLEPGSTEAAWSRNRNAQTILIDLGPR